MKNRILNNNIRTIKKSFSRFFSLFIMSFLGVFVFTGLQSTSPDMMKTLDQFYDKSNVYDLQIVSTLGFSEKNMKALEELDSIKEVEQVYYKDLLTKLKKTESVIRVSSLPEKINQVRLLQGRLPKKENEIVVEENLLVKNNLKIGDIILLDESFKNNKVKIVGTVESPIYINNVSVNQNRGETTVGTGTIDYYTFVLKDNFKSANNTMIYTTVKDAKKLETASIKYEEKISDSIKEINEIKIEQENLRKQEILTMQPNLNISSNWYLYDRTNDATYTEYVDDTQSLKNLSKIFPTLFFAVAVLVSLISMNRMVEDDRVEIGTLKSLGFHSRAIISKYVMFSLLATLCGAILGGFLGSTWIPRIVFSIYSMLFTIPNFCVEIYIGPIFISLLLSILCICGSTIVTARIVLKEKPSELMRPKAPKNGKKVLLEKIPFIWKKLKFSNKVIVRNLFRYKKRVFVTIFGIAGCTALILCGFGIRDAIVDITSMQYEHTFKFDAMVYVNQFKTEQMDSIFSDNRIEKVIPTMMISADVDKTKVTMFVVENKDDLNHVVHLTNENNKTVSLSSNKVVITDKLADLKNLKVNDKIQLIDTNHNSYQFEISDIVKNYLGHYIYIDQATLKSISFEPNVIYMNTKQIDKKEQEDLTKTLLQNNQIIKVSFHDSLIKSVSDMLDSLNKVVVILIVLAMLLAFVVLYNLSNINIYERKREIATLKVLGFYHREVDDYITKETWILTFLGIVLGLIFGYFLTNMVITTVEIEKARFIHHINFSSFLYSSLIAIFFSFIVNIVTHFSLKKIDMIESLKSIE